jgi:hypothetical protein
MSSKISHSIKHRDNPKDKFYTPKTVVEAHLKLIPHKPNDIWLDPFYGAGIYYNNFPTNNKDYTEIKLNKDFFDYNNKVDIICSNPPYSILDNVFKKCIELKPRVISLLLLHGAFTPKRMELLKDNNYGLISIFTCKVFAWYGFAEIYTFEYNKKWDNVNVSFDRIVHRLTEEELKEQNKD